jgi:hypothetical protein
MIEIEIVSDNTSLTLTITPVSDSHLDWYRFVLRDKMNGRIFEGFKTVEDLIDFVAKRIDFP